MTTARRRALLDAAEALAVERATVFRLARRNGKGEVLTGFKLLDGSTPRKRENLLAKGAHPVLASSEWRAIYEEVGLRE